MDVVCTRLGPEPLATLRKFRADDQGRLMFGSYEYHDLGAGDVDAADVADEKSVGIVRVGDAVHVHALRASVPVLGAVAKTDSK